MQRREGSLFSRGTIQSLASSFALLPGLVLAIAIMTPATFYAQTFTILHSFSGYDGAQPISGLVMDRGGSLYGATPYGGDINCSNRDGARFPGSGGPPPGCGVVFKLKRAGSGWIENPLYIFPGNLQGDATNYPNGVVVAPNGSVFGTTAEGGSGHLGTLFELNPSPTAPVTVISPWTYTRLVQFEDSNGAYPSGLLKFDSSGNLYGVTVEGGAFGDGAFYELTHSGSSWTQNVLYSFSGGTDGNEPRGFVFDEVGDVYGTATRGGNQGCEFNSSCGTVFKLAHSQSGWTETTLHSFQYGVDGVWPGPPIRDAAGNLYGITTQDGPGGGGTVWELSPSNGGWTFILLHTFPTATVDNLGPYALTMDSAGNLYGIVNWGGHYNYGEAFKLSPSNGGWTFTDLHDFGLDTCVPQGAPVLDLQGNIYGMTEYCGTADFGAVWEITP